MLWLNDCIHSAGDGDDDIGVPQSFCYFGGDLSFGRTVNSKFVLESAQPSLVPTNQNDFADGREPNLVCDFRTVTEEVGTSPAD